MTVPPASVQRQGLSAHILVDGAEFLPPSEITQVLLPQRGKESNGGEPKMTKWSWHQTVNSF